MGDAVMIPVYRWRRDTDARGRPAWVTTDPAHPDTREVWIVYVHGGYAAVHCPAGALRRDSWADHYLIAGIDPGLDDVARRATLWLYSRVAGLAWRTMQGAGALPTE